MYYLSNYEDNYISQAAIDIFPEAMAGCVITYHKFSAVLHKTLAGENLGGFGG